jgi:hypothetical protein
LADVRSQVSRDIDSRLRELRPVLEEVRRLEIAREALSTDGRPSYPVPFLSAPDSSPPSRRMRAPNRLSRQELVSQELTGEQRTAIDGSNRPAWDWGVELRDEERCELELLRGTVAELRARLDQAHDSLTTCRQRQREASQALRQLDEAGPWRRRQVRRALRDRRLL